MPSRYINPTNHGLLGSGYMTQHEATDRPWLLSAVRCRRLRRWFGVRVHKLCLAGWGLESPPLLECGLGRKDGAFCRASPNHRLGRVRDFDRTGQNERRGYRDRLGEGGQDVLFGELNKVTELHGMVCLTTIVWMPRSTKECVNMTKESIKWQGILESLPFAKAPELKTRCCCLLKQYGTNLRGTLDHI